MTATIEGLLFLCFRARFVATKEGDAIRNSGLTGYSFTDMEDWRAS